MLQTADAEGRILIQLLSQTNRLRGINKPLSVCAIYITHKEKKNTPASGFHPSQHANKLMHVATHHVLIHS